MTVTSLNATRLKWLRDEVMGVLASKRWMDHATLLRRVQKRWGWATDRQVTSAVDQLWDEGLIDSRTHKRPAGPGSVDTHVNVTQWKLLVPA